VAMLNEILAARYEQLLTRKFNITGGAPAPQLTPEIGCNLSLEVGEEGHILQSEYLCSGRFFTTGNAGQSGSIQLTNPVGSNILLVVEQIVAQALSAVVNGINCGILNTAGPPNTATAGDVVIVDTRVASVGAYTRLPTGRVTGGVNTPPTVVQPNLFHSRNAVGVPYVYSLGVVLAPGWGVNLVQIDLAGSMNGFFRWREVPLAAGEVGPF